MKYTERSHTVDAVQWQLNNIEEVQDFLEEHRISYSINIESGKSVALEINHRLVSHGTFIVFDEYTTTRVDGVDVIIPQFFVSATDFLRKYRPTRIPDVN